MSNRLILVLILSYVSTINWRQLCIKEGEGSAFAISAALFSIAIDIWAIVLLWKWALA